MYSKRFKFYYYIMEEIEELMTRLEENKMVINEFVRRSELKPEYELN